MSDCIFCKIIAKEIPTQFVYEDDDIIAFNDIVPKAPTHLLIVPKKHIEKLSDLKLTDADLAAKLLLTVNKIAEQAGITHNGFRVVINNGGYAGQEVPHIHLHVLGGKPMGWNPT